MFQTFSTEVQATSRNAATSAVPTGLKYLSSKAHTFGQHGRIPLASFPACPVAAIPRSPRHTRRRLTLSRIRPLANGAVMILMNYRIGG